MTLGDLHWVDFAPKGGHAQAGRRPAIVVQSQRASTRIPTILVIPLTSQLDALRFPGTVLIESNPDSGLRRASVAIDQRYFSNRIGNVSQKVLDEIFSALDELTERT